MSTKTFKNSVVCGALALASLVLSQAKAQSAPSGDETAAASAATSSIDNLDIPSFLIRNLYFDPDKDKAPEGFSWKHGWGLSGYWNPEHQFIDGNFNKHQNGNNEFGMLKKSIGVALSKDVSRTGAVRLGVTYGQMDDVIKRLSASLDYVWNLSDYYWGYSRSRKSEFLMTIGGTAGMADNLSDKKLYGGAQTGLQYRMNLSNYMSFFVEPQFRLYSEQSDRQTSIYKADAALDLLVGLYFRSDKLNLYASSDLQGKERVKAALLDNTYIQLYGGYTTATQTENGFQGMTPYSKHGLNYGFSVGKWINQSLGFRLGYFDLGASMYKYNSSVRYLTLRGGRAELLFNPLSFISNDVSFHRLGVDLSVGAEMGPASLHGKTYAYNAPGDALNAGFFGLTGAGALKYFVNDHAAVFGEARVSNPVFDDRSESLTSFALGLEYYVSNYPRYSRWWVGDTREPMVVDRLSNHNRFFFEVAGGLGHQVHWDTGYRNLADVTGSVSFGNRFNDYLSARAHAQFNLLRNKPEMYGSDSEAGIVLGADAMFNLTNAWMGLDKTNTRMADIYLFAGPTYHVGAGSDQVGKGLGGEFGMQLTRRITPELELFLEPRYEMFANATNRWDYLAGLIYYRDANRERHTAENSVEHDRSNLWFAETAVGLGQAMDNPDGMDWPDLRLSVGRRFGPYSSVRMNALFTDLRNKQEKHHDMKGEVGIDYMFNFTNLWYGVDPYRRTNLRLYAGPTFQAESFRGSSEIRVGLGMEAGAQWTYALNDRMDLMVEPRFEKYFGSLSAGGDYKNKSNFSDPRWDLFGGVIWYNQDYSDRADRFNYDEPLRNNKWFYQAGLGVSLPTAWKGGAREWLDMTSPLINLGVGYNFDYYSSVRGNLFSRFQRNTKHSIDDHRYLIYGDVDYMLHLTNLLMGVNQHRRQDLKIFAGPQFRFMGMTRSDEAVGFDLGMVGGAQYLYHLNNDLDLFLEPRLNYWPSNKTVSHMDMIAGLVYYHNNKYVPGGTLPVSDTYRNDNWFVEAGLGVTHPFTWRGDRSFMSMYGGSATASVGYVWGPYSSVRANLTAHHQRHGNDTYEQHTNIPQAGLHYMLDMTNIVMGRDPYRRFDVKAFVGPQVMVNNFSEGAKNYTVHLGAVGGLNGSYHLTDNMDLFLEVRDEYWKDEQRNDKLRRNGPDMRWDVYAGTRFFRHKNEVGTAGSHNRRLLNINDNHTWFAELSAGLSATSTRKGGSFADHVDPVVHAGIGNHINNYSSVRLRGNITWNRNAKTSSESAHQFIAEAEADYMYNLTNRVLGIDPYRHFDLVALGGPTVQVDGLRSGLHDLDFNLGFTFGGQAIYHITEHWDAFLEPTIKFMHPFESEYANRLAMDLGLAYRFNSRYTRGQRSFELNNRLYTQFLFGGQPFSWEHMPLKIENLSIWGDFDWRLGWRFNRFFNVQAGIFADRVRVKRNVDTQYNGIRGEAVLNLINLFEPDYNAYDNRFNLNASIGGVLGFVKHSPDGTKREIGLSVAGQAQYRMLENTWGLLELRATQNTINGLHVPITAQLGVQYDFGNKKSDVKTLSTNWYLEGGLGLYNMSEGAYEVALGYDFNAIHGVRAMAAAGLNHDKGRGHYMGASLDYMVNLSNLLLGHDDNTRHVDFSAFAGPDYVMRGVRSKITNHEFTKIFTDVNKNTIGFNWGARLDWHLNKQVSLFTEPRFNIVPFGAEVVQNRWDMFNFSATFGLKYRIMK